LLYYDLPPGAPTVAGVRAPIVVAFVLSALAFVPLGQLIAVRLARFHHYSSQLRGYAFDLGGSLLGVIGFAIASLLRLFPVVWFSVAFTVGAVFFRRDKRMLALYALLAALSLGIVQKAEKAEVYSPYYALSKKLAPD